MATTEQPRVATDQQQAEIAELAAEIWARGNGIPYNQARESAEHNVLDRVE